MKKNLLLLSLFTALTSVAFSQADINIIKAGDPNILNDSTINFYVDPYIEFSSVVFVINTTSSTMGINLRRDIISLTPHDTNEICWGGLCSNWNVNVSPNTVSVVAHDTVKGGSGLDFNGDNTNYGLGTSTIRYVFYNSANHNDSSWVLVNYISSATGIPSMNDANISFSAPYPNPANNFVSFNYTLSNGVQSANLKIFNLIGECVQTLPLSASKNKTTIDAQSMPSGIYVCEVEANGCQPVYQKLIVTH